MFGKDDEINVQSVHKKLNEIMAARGKKGTDRKEQIELLHELLNVARDNTLGPAILVKIQFNIIMSIYDYNPSVSDPMKAEFWEKVSPTLEVHVILVLHVCVCVCKIYSIKQFLVISIHYNVIYITWVPVLLKGNHI